MDPFGRDARLSYILAAEEHAAYKQKRHNALSLGRVKLQTVPPKTTALILRTEYNFLVWRFQAHLEVSNSVQSVVRCVPIVGRLWLQEIAPVQSLD